MQTTDCYSDSDVYTTSVFLADYAMVLTPLWRVMVDAMITAVPFDWRHVSSPTITHS